MVTSSRGKSRTPIVHSSWRHSIHSDLTCLLCIPRAVWMYTELLEIEKKTLAIGIHGKRFLYAIHLCWDFQHIHPLGPSKDNSFALPKASLGSLSTSHVTCTDQQTMARIHTLVASLSVGIISKQCRNAPEVIRGILLSILT